MTESALPLTYHLVIADVVKVQSFATLEDLTEAVRKAYQDEQAAPAGNKALIFEGSRAFISKGTPKYILMPDGKKLPLLAENEIVPDEEGHLSEPVQAKEQTEEPEQFDFDRRGNVHEQPAYLND